MGTEIVQNKLDFSAVPEVGDWAQETAKWDSKAQVDPSGQEWGGTMQNW